MSNEYIVMRLRGGTKDEHLTANNRGFIGEDREVTVDTTDWTLRVHDGATIGGHPLMKADTNIEARKIIFSDGQSLQDKFDTGQLGGGSENPEPIPPETNTAPRILAVDVKNKQQNGTATIVYYIEDKEQTDFIHELSINNGNSFSSINPDGENPYEYTIHDLSLGQNICALRISDGELSTTQYFIVNIPNENIDTAPVVKSLDVKQISTSGAKVEYAVEDKQNDDVQRHRLSTDNGLTYIDVYPSLINGKYEVNINGLSPGTEYYCRIKVVANGLESLSYGFSFITSSVN